jgi:hypothetical protein
LIDCSQSPSETFKQKSWLPHNLKTRSQFWSWALFPKKGVSHWFYTVKRRFWRKICYRQPRTCKDMTIFASNKTKLHLIEQKFRLPRCNKSMSKNNLCHKGLQMYEVLSSEIKNEQSVVKFKKFDLIWK